MIIFLPETVALSSPSGTIGAVTVAVTALFLLGLLIEGVADHQKYLFKIAHPERFISSGLWRYSRHPNYFGEMLCCWGLFLASAQFLSGWVWLTVAGPAYLTFLPLFVTGVPPLEKRSLEKYGENYALYAERTSSIIPLPPYVLMKSITSGLRLTPKEFLSLMKPDVW